MKIALGIAAQPPPSMPEFTLDSSLNDPEALSSFVDDFFGKERNNRAETFAEGNNFGGIDGWNEIIDDIFDKPKSEEEREAELLTEEDKDGECNKMKNDYNVIIGVSWGNLPYDLQEKWAAFKCDMYFSGTSF